MAERSADPTISVSCRQLDAAGWTCDVVVADDRSQTSHVVTVSEAELTRYADSSTDVGAFVADAFRFLLERESKESILRRFAIGDIERYFPEFGDRRRAS
jgi:hypothetical protein